MQDGLKQKTIHSLFWSAFDKVGTQLVAFVVGILTARLLSPSDFGLIGALTVFTILSNALVEGGFTAALVRRKSNTDSEYAAVFYFNLFLSFLLYVALYFSAPAIAAYFRQPELCSLSRFIFLAVIFNSFGLIQNAILTKNLSFRILTRVNLISVTVSGLCALGLILFFDFSYWALAWQQIIQVVLKSLLLWFFGHWRLGCKPHFGIIKELFSFSFILLMTSIVTTIVKYIYNFVIGRIYTVQDLGYYTQAYKYQQIPSSIISATLTSVAYPVLSKIDNEEERLVVYRRKLVRLTAFWSFPVMLGLFAVAHDFVLVLLSEKWLPVVPYFKVLLLAGIFYPFHTLSLNMLTAIGLPKWNFGLEMVRNAFVLLSLLCFNDSIMQMLIGFLFATALSVFVDMIVLRKKLKYNIRHQLKDVFPYMAISVAMLFVVKSLSLLCLSSCVLLFLQIFVGAVFYFSILKLFGSKLLNEALHLFLNKEKNSDLT